MERRPLLQRWLYGALGLLAVLVGVTRAYQIRWVCDDAFITFRYIDHLLQGHGLVYNLGERVEGYTHFLWLSLIALLRWVGIELIAATQGLGLLFFAGTLGLLVMIPVRLYRTPTVPVAALILALHFDFQIWATGGLETSLFTFLSVFLLYLAAVADLRRGRTTLLAGVVSGLIVMTRPDGIVFTALTFLFLAVRLSAEGQGRREATRSLGLYLLPIVALLVPYSIWKIAYYGSLLPNTYYAKSGGGFYFGQGIFYVGLYLKAYLSSFLFLVGIGALVALILRANGESPRSRWRRLLITRPGRTLSLAVILALGYMIVFVMRVGGDFMYARFLHPLIPMFYLAGEIGLRWAIGRRTAVLLILSAGLVFLVLQEKARRDGLYVEKDGMTRKTQQHRGIADEHWYWSHESGGMTLIERHEAIGCTLAGYFEGQDVRVLLGGQASLGYYGRFPVCIEYAGLTDRTIARQPVAARGRPGHEKGPTDAYLVERGVHFTFMKAPFHDAPYRFVYFRMGEGAVRAEMFTYDAELMRHLRRKFPDEVTFVPFEEHLDRWIERLPLLPRNEAEQEYAAFRDFYFRHNNDPARESRIESTLDRTLTRPRVP